MFKIVSCFTFLYMVTKVNFSDAVKSAITNVESITIPGKNIERCKTFKISYKYQV